MFLVCCVYDNNSLILLQCVAFISLKKSYASIPDVSHGHISGWQFQYSLLSNCEIISQKNFIHYNKDPVMYS